MLVLPLGNHYRVWQLSLTFSSISRCQTKLQTFNKKCTLPSLSHTDGRTKAHSWKKTTWVVPLQAMCICCPRGAFHPCQPLLPLLLWFIWMWFSTGEIIFWKSFMFGYKQAPGLCVIQERHGGCAHEAHHVLPNGMMFTACHQLLIYEITLSCRRVSLLLLADWSRMKSIKLSTKIPKAVLDHRNTPDPLQDGGDLNPS